MISFCICAYNEEKSILKTIFSILPQVGKNDEVIIVASGCTDKTVNKVRSAKDSRIKIIIEKKRRGKAAATNTAVSYAKGNIIVYLDADILIDKKAVKALISNFEDPSIAAVSARMKIKNHKSFFDHMCNFAREALHEQKINENKIGKFWSLNGYLFAFRKKDYQKLDESNLVEDALLGWLIYKKGLKVLYEPNSVVYEKAPQNLRDYVNQKSRVRVGWWQMKHKYNMNISEKRNFTHLAYLLKNPYAWVYLFLEIIVWIIAYIRYHQKNYIWPIIHSSKI